MARLPEGTTTFMLTDLEGSTRAWENRPRAMRTAMARHDAILAGAVRDHKGELVEAGREGDSVLAVFRTAASAAVCALEIQSKFATESWPPGLDLNLRVALHTGEAQLRDGHYFGPALNRCARLLAICHPGQILLTKATESMLADEFPAGSELRDLGPHRLKDLARPEQVFQLNDLAQPSEFPRLQSLPQQRTNLPHYLTNFVGRGDELAALQSLLANSRMVTLTGAGGSGKTRLAAELGLACLDLWPDGVWWVELAPVTDSRQVPGAVVAALELPGRGPALEVVIAWLAPRRAVLVLDNCEHLVAACARLCEAVLQRCPELTIIATSREALGVPGEARFSVASMAATEGVQLFEARARLVAPDFRVTDSNLQTVTQICQRLDGMPLAIELAAARLDMMSEQEAFAQLSDRFHLLTGGSRTAPERQQTMIATIDWSYRLLSEEEALLFRRLSVFRGGFTLESVQAVCAEGIRGSVLDMIASLVHKSMVVAERAHGSASRYRLLESQLAYAEDRLQHAGELELVRRRHYEYYRDSLGVRTRNPVLAQPPPGFAESQWLARESANLWAALGWARDNAVDLGLSLAAHMWDRSQITFGDTTQARSLLADLLDRSPEKGAPRVYALCSAVWLAIIQGDFEAALQLGADGVELARGLRDPEALALALNRAAHAHSVKGQAQSLPGELDTANEMFEEANSLLRSSSNRPLVNTIKNNLGWNAVVRGDYQAGRDVLDDCVATARVEKDDWGIGAYGSSLAFAQWGLNDQVAARASFIEALKIACGFMNDPGIRGCLLGLLCVASASGDDERAVRLGAVAHRLSDEWSVRDEPWDEIQAEEALRRSQARLGKRNSDAAWKRGWAMTVDQTVEYALGESEPEASFDAGPLSRRQRDVATLVAGGLTNREIAERLFIAERSAEGHVERIRNKLGVRSRTEVATWAVEHGLTAPQTTERGTRHGPPFGRRRQSS